MSPRKAKYQRMFGPQPAPRHALWAGLLGLLLLAPGCGDQVGDSCSTNVDCSPYGDRICDTSQAGGYCTIQGCDPDSCPDEAVCIRFFPTSFLSVPCNPLTEDAVDPTLSPTNDCTADEVCLSSGLCSQRTQERRFCMKACEADTDCRGDYECRRTGTLGAETVPDPDNPGQGQLSFCAQRF